MPAQPPGDASPKPEEKKEEGSTALLPRALFGADPQVGAVQSFKIVHIYADEVEVAPESAETPKDQPSTPDQEIDAMDKQQ